MKNKLHDILNILISKEKKTVFALALADVAINILDILFLAGLLFVMGTYLAALPPKGSILPWSILKARPVLIISLFAILFILKNLAAYRLNKFQHNFAYGVASRISANNLSSFLEGDYQDYVSLDSSIEYLRICQRPVEFAHYILSGLQQIFSQLILICLSLAAILWYNPILFTLLMLVLFPPVIIMAVAMKKRLKQLGISAKNAGEKATQNLREALTGYVESNTFGQNHFFKERYKVFQTAANNHLAEKLSLQTVPTRLIEVFAVIGFLLLILLNQFVGSDPVVPVLTIGAFMAAAYKIIPGIVKIMNLSGQINAYSFSIAACSALKGAEVVNSELASITDIRFQNVSFSHKGQLVLKTFSMEIRHGDLAGIFGASGQGKTTIIKLLLGFLDPDSGEILINGVSTSQMERRSFWKKIAYSKQEPFILHETVLTNIILLDPDKAKNRSIDDIIKVTGLDQIAGRDLSELVSENGKNYSGGQAQRILFARTLYREADLIILDEPFNELDTESEIAMLKVLRNMADNGKMIILVTHSREALSFCNKEILLNAQ